MKCKYTHDGKCAAKIMAACLCIQDPQYYSGPEGGAVEAQHVTTRDRGGTDEDRDR